MNEGQWIEVGGIPRFIPDNYPQAEVECIEEVGKSDKILEEESLIDLTEEDNVEHF